jgi:hypothetical protein
MLHKNALDNSLFIDEDECSAIGAHKGSKTKTKNRKKEKKNKKIFTISQFHIKNENRQQMINPLKIRLGLEADELLN